MAVGVNAEQELREQSDHFDAHGFREIVPQRNHEPFAEQHQLSGSPLSGCRCHQCLRYRLAGLAAVVSPPPER